MRLLLAFLFSVNAFAGAGTFPQGDSVKMLRDKLKFKTGRTIESTDVNPMITATPADKGSVLINDNGLFIKMDTGTSTNWRRLDEKNGTDLNFVSDSSFESETFAPTVSVAGGTVTFPLFTTNDKLYSEFNTKYYQVAHTGLSAANYSVNYSQARTGLDGKQGLFSIWAKVNADLDLCIELDASGTCESTVSLIADDTWRKYEIPFVFGASSVEFNFFNASLTGDITLQLDKAYIGVIPDGYIQDVGQANIFAEVEIPASFNGGCDWFDRTSTTEQLPQSDADCGDAVNGKLDGNITMSDTKVPNFTLKNVKQGYKYKIEISNLIYKSSTTANLSCNTFLSFNGGVNFIKFSNIFYGVNGDMFTNERKSASYTVTATSSGDLPFGFYISESVLNTCQIDTRLQPFRVTVTELPPHNSTIVSQNTELVKVVARMNDSLSVPTNTRTDVIYKNELQDNFNAYNPTTGIFTSPKETCYSIKAGLLYENTMSESAFIDVNICRGTTCVGLGDDVRVADRKRANIQNAQGSVSTSNFCMTKNEQIIIGTFQNSGSTVNTLNGAHLFNELSISELPKSATIIGKFENINSSELVKVEAKGNDGSSITTTTAINFTEIEDNLNTWNGSRFTAPKDSYYLFNGKVRVTTTIAALRIFINGVNDGFIGYEGNTSDMVQFTAIRKLNKDDYIEIKSDTAGTLANLPLAHSLEITELPDTESIIKNLTQERTKCQTKYLSADVTASDSTALSSINFTGLTSGKRYSLEYVSRWLIGASDTFAQLTILQNAFDLDADVVGNGSASNISFSKSLKNVFVSNGGDITHSILSFGASTQIYGNGTSETRVTLCELPSSYVETNEW